MNRREVLQAMMALASGAPALSTMAQETYPTRPVRVICGSAGYELDPDATRSVPVIREM